MRFLSAAAVFTVLASLAAPGLLSSCDQSINVYADQLDACSFTPLPGTYQFATDVSIGNSDPEADIYYTVDNSEPTESSTPYTGPFTVHDNTIIRARAFKASYRPSPITTGAYNVVWKVETELPERRLAFGVACHEGKLYYIGGWINSVYSNKVDIYDFTAKIWSTGAAMPTARSSFGIEASSGIIYCLGGYDGSNVLTTVEAYDIASNTWTRDTNSGGTLSPMPSSRSTCRTAIHDGKIYCFGGTSGGYLLTCCSYDIDGNSWASIASLPGVRVGFDVALAGAEIYCLGGYNSDAGQWPDNSWAYDPVTDSWDQTLANIATNRQYLGVASISGFIFCFGGDISPGSSSYTKKNEAYDPALDTWMVKSSIPTANANAYENQYADSVVSDGGYVYLLNPVSETNDRAVYRYNPAVDH